MDDEQTTLSQSAPRTRARRFDAPRFSRSFSHGDNPDPRALIEDSPAIEEEASEEKKAEAEPPAQPRSDQATTGPEWLRQVLRKLKWSESDLARILVGPSQSHLTAEGLFRQHAANPTEDQARLVEAFQRAGASQVPRDPSILSGLDPNHLLPEQPADLAQIVSQFAQLPEVQKRRFLALLDEQKSPSAGNGMRTETAGNPANPLKAGAASSPKKEPAGKEPASKGDEVLSTVLKGSFDTLGTLIKGLLGSERAGKTAPSSSKGSTKRTPEASPREDDETPDDTQTDESETDETSESSSAENVDDSESSESADEDTTPYGPPAPDELLSDLGGDREPD